mmetsp:Transcript_14522/g.39836  ORF Transcript_14522/g.39836 Transcript_14522/m.39836 type:complete len:1166 (-) Transcript_14522:24-3521(-)
MVPQRVPSPRAPGWGPRVDPVARVVSPRPVPTTSRVPVTKSRAPVPGWKTGLDTDSPGTAPMALVGSFARFSRQQDSLLGVKGTPGAEPANLVHLQEVAPPNPDSTGSRSTLSPGGGVSHPDEPDELGASELDLAEREAKMHRELRRTIPPGGGEVRTVGSMSDMGHLKRPLPSRPRGIDSPQVKRQRAGSPEERALAVLPQPAKVVTIGPDPYAKGTLQSRLIRPSVTLFSWPRRQPVDSPSGCRTMGGSPGLRREGLASPRSLVVDLDQDGAFASSSNSSPGRDAERRELAERRAPKALEPRCGSPKPSQAEDRALALRTDDASRPSQADVNRSKERNQLVLRLSKGELERQLEATRRTATQATHQASELELKSAGLMDQLSVVAAQRDALVAECAGAASENKELERKLAEVSERERQSRLSASKLESEKECSSEELSARRALEAVAEHVQANGQESDCTERLESDVQCSEKGEEDMQAQRKRAKGEQSTADGLFDLDVAGCSKRHEEQESELQEQEAQRLACEELAKRLDTAKSLLQQELEASVQRSEQLAEELASSAAAKRELESGNEELVQKLAKARAREAKAASTNEELAKKQLSWKEREASSSKSQSTLEAEVRAAEEDARELSARSREAERSGEAKVSELEEKLCEALSGGSHFEQEFARADEQSKTLNARTTRLERELVRAHDASKAQRLSCERLTSERCSFRARIEKVEELQEAADEISNAALVEAQLLREKVSAEEETARSESSMVQNLEALETSTRSKVDDVSEELAAHRSAEQAQAVAMLEELRSEQMHAETAREQLAEFQCHQRSEAARGEDLVRELQSEKAVASSSRAQLTFVQELSTAEQAMARAAKEQLMEFEALSSAELVEARSRVLAVEAQLNTQEMRASSVVDDSSTTPAPVSVAYMNGSPVLSRMRQALEDPTLADPMSDAVTRIMPNVLLSGEAAALNADLLTRESVTHVISCLGTVAEVHQRCRHCLALNCEDEPYYPVLQHVEQIHEFLRTLRSNRCLIYCRKGRNRSAALAIALLMRAKNKQRPATDFESLLQSSWELVTMKHGRVLTNYGFQRQLLLYAHNGCRWAKNWGPENWLLSTEAHPQRVHRLRDAVLTALEDAEERKDELVVRPLRGVAARFTYEWMKRRQQCLTPSQYKLMT